MLLLVLLAAEGATILDVRGLITPHIYLGLLLIGPVLLKCASTGYRFAGYYRRRPAYLDKGPPLLVLRLLGPVVILSTLAVLGTGVGLIFTGPAHRDPLLTLHKASFIVWFAVLTIHVLGHVVEAAGRTWWELRGRGGSQAGRRRRWRGVALACSLIAGVGLASALLPPAHGWTGHRYEQHAHSGRKR